MHNIFSYEDWRINYQGDAQAARAAWEEMRNLRIRMQELRESLDIILRERNEYKDRLYYLQRQPLSEELIYKAINGVDSLRAIEVARAVEAAHGIK